MTTLNTEKGTPKDDALSQMLQRKFLFPLILGLFIVYSFFIFAEENIEVSTESVTLKDGATSNVVSVVPASPQPAKKPDLPPKLPVPTAESLRPPLDINTMLQAFIDKRQEMLSKMEVDYGPENFKRMLLDHGRSAIHPPSGPDGPSKDRMRRKMMIKILDAQAATQNRRRSLQRKDWSNANTTTSHSRSRSRRTQHTDSTKFPKYVWATGGHSATAGHGNFWRESYTGFLERAVKDVFAAVGIEFVGRNYAMGGTSSGPEVAMCTKEIYGKDIDILSWDTGMTDGKNYASIIQYFFRAAIERHQPAFVALHISKHKGREEAVKRTEENGLAAFLLDEGEDKEMTTAIPDTFGLSDEEISQMPAFIRNFKCGKQIEKGDPNCKKLKFNTTMCTNRKFKTSWHPGWRWHALSGNLIALWITYYLEDALRELVAQASNPGFADKLRKDEEEAYKNFMKNELPLKMLDKIEIPQDVSKELFFKGANFCHTGLLPAEIRHLGILTQSSKLGEDSYDTGIELKDAERFLPKDEVMPLVYEQGHRQTCPIPTNKDYKDYFYINSLYGWSELSLPNDAELKAYGTGNPLSGVIVVCFSVCNWGKCPKGNILGENILEGKAAMEVNGRNVTGLTKLGSCDFLKHEEGHIWEPNSNGRFQIRAKVHEDKSFLRISSFVVW